MSNERELDKTPHALPTDGKAQWESPTVRPVGSLGDVLLTTSKGGLSEHDPGIEAYKPSGQDH